MENIIINYCLWCNTISQILDERFICPDCADKLEALDKHDRSIWLRRLRQRKAYKLNPEKIKEKNRLGHERNKESRNLTRRQLRKENPENAKKKDKERYEKNHEERIQRSRDFRKNNPEKVKAWNHRWNEANKDIIAEYKRNWIKQNPEKVKLQRQRYSIKNSEKLKKYNKNYYLKNRENLLNKNKEYNASEHGKQVREKYYLVHREKIINYLRHYRIINKEQLTKKARQKYKDNRELYIRRGKEYRLRNIDKIKIRSREKYQENREIILAELRQKYYKINQGKFARNSEKSFRIRIDTQIERVHPQWRKTIHTWVSSYIDRKKRLYDRGAKKAFSLSTIWTYCTNIASFFQWVDNYKSNKSYNLYNINDILILEFLENNPSTYSSLNKFFQFCQLKKLLLVNPCSTIEPPKTKHKPPETLSLEEQSEIFCKAILCEDPPASLLIILALVHGISTLDAQNLTIKHINFYQKTINIPGTISRRIPIDDDTLQVLKTYFTWRDKKLANSVDPGFLFITNASIVRMQSVSYTYLFSILKVFDEDLTVTKLNNCFILNMLLETGVNIRVVADWAGLKPSSLIKKAILWGFNLS